MTTSNSDLADFLEELAGELDLDGQQSTGLELAAQRLRSFDRFRADQRGSQYVVSLTVQAETAEEALRQVIYADGEVIDADISAINVERIG